MASFNKVILLGNMVADPELRQTPSGKSVCSFRIGVQRRFARTQDQESGSDFFTINAWEKTAEFVARYFKKGSAILVCGSLQNRSWTDQQGQKRYVTEVNAEEVTFGSSATGAGSAPAGEAGGYTPGAYSAPTFNNAQGASFEEIPDDGSLPF